MSTMVIRAARRRLSALRPFVWILALSCAGPLPSGWAQAPQTPVEPDAAPQNEEAQAAAAPEAEAAPVSPSVQVSGSIWRSVPGIVFLQTPIGKLSLSSKTSLRDIRSSHKITLYVHGTTTVVDVRDRGPGTLIHRYVTTTPEAISPDTKTLALWTPDGEQTVPMGQFATKLLGHNGQKPLTVEIDAAGAMRGIHDMQFDLQVSQVPHAASHLHVLLNGTVAKLKSSYVFLRTPLGIVTVSTKTGVRNAKVGQDMSLWIHEGHVAIDLLQDGTTARRFLTGPLTYASADRAALTLHTPEGEQSVTPSAGKTVLSSLKEGTPITVELDHEGTVVDIRRVN
ncbi:MAG: hypothetical protein KF814_11925 [Nitrospiraceae bacterium]|nr:hypothetical protein [Nitrospiraceae bacterium]